MITVSLWWGKHNIFTFGKCKYNRMFTVYIIQATQYNMWLCTVYNSSYLYPMASTYAVFAFHGQVASAYQTGLCGTLDDSVGVTPWGGDYFLQSLELGNRLVHTTSTVSSFLFGNWTFRTFSILKGENRLVLINVVLYKLAAIQKLSVSSCFMGNVRRVTVLS